MALIEKKLSVTSGEETTDPPRKIIHADKKNKRICKIEQIRLFSVAFP